MPFTPKRTLRQLLPLLLLLAVGACKGTEEKEAPKEPTMLTVHLVPTTLSAADGTLEAIIICDQPWTAELEKTPWAAVSDRTEDEFHNGRVYFTVEPNNAEGERTGTVVFRSGSREERLTFSQGGTDTFFSPNSLLLTGIETGKIQFTAPSDWTAAVTEGDDWLHLEKTVGKTGSSEIRCTPTDANEDLGSRSANIRVSFAGGELDIPVLQPQQDVILTDGKTYSFSYEGGSFSVLTATNIDYTIECSADWVHHISTKALNEFTETFAVDENPAAETRSAEIRFTGKDKPDVVITLAVVQLGMDPILRVKVPGCYGTERGDFVLGADGWNQSGRTRGADGSFSWRLMNAASPSVLQISGLDPAATAGTEVSFLIELTVRNFKTWIQRTSATVVFDSGDLLYLRVSDNEYFIIQK